MKTPVFDAPPRGWKARAKYTCPICKGSGKTEPWDYCEDCYGIGKVDELTFTRYRIMDDAQKVTEMLASFDCCDPDDPHDLWEDLSMEHLLDLEKRFKHLLEFRK